MLVRVLCPRPHHNADIWVVVIALAHVHDFVGVYREEDKMFNNPVVPQLSL
jgi:hypothetical protein